MLVLSRKRDERIMIGDNIVITIVDIRGDKVRIGVEAPKHVSVHRLEIYEQLLKQKQQTEVQQRGQEEGKGEAGGTTTGQRPGSGLAQFRKGVVKASSPEP